MSKVSFEPIEEEDSALEHIVFNAEFDGEKISCAITYEALTDHYEAEYSDPLFAFMMVRSEVEALAEKMILNGQADSGKIIITTEIVSNNQS